MFLKKKLCFDTWTIICEFLPPNDFISIIQINKELNKIKNMIYITKDKQYTLKGKTSIKLLKDINKKKNIFYNDVNVKMFYKLIIEIKNYIGEFIYY